MGHYFLDTQYIILPPRTASNSLNNEIVSNIFKRQFGIAAVVHCRITEKIWKNWDNFPLVFFMNTSTKIT